MVNDTISDMLTRIRNANLAHKKTVSVSKTKIHEKICEILEKEGFITSFQISENQINELIIHLKYQTTFSDTKNKVFGKGKGTNVVFVKGKGNGSSGLGKPCITNLKRISKPGLRVYTNHKEIPKILGGMGIIILSTSQGLMTDRDARSRHLGGEVICSIW
uniref:Small ribosomal subunit protein uS8c n=1 Tax=Parachlorella kessleri TaxID=3074 RepID=C7BEY0_PARKE|nr:ribosomal protein S8 [Parachlorella kessleri]ACQ90976.1 ribosomal protein S8 [Parachlorella kessleri]